MMEKNYSKDFAYGCLYEIPIPNTTLDTSFTPQQEKIVLMEIFNQTDGHRWENNTLWGDTSVSHCSWYGVTCDNTTHSYIISLSLEENNLRGTLPGSLWKLRNLQGLCLYSNNGLGGKLDQILAANMTALLRLDLAFNKISGTLPGEIISKMKSLVKVQLCCQMGEGLSGEIPRNVGNLTELQVLSLGQNRLTGSIPRDIARLKKLWFLDLESATLTGGFENLFSLSSLRYLHISLAGLPGELPDNLGYLFPEMIQFLSPGNHFWGPIPSTIGNMTKLKELDLAFNDLEGQIPKSIGDIPELQVVDFSGNQFTSLEPGIKFKSQSMEVLILSGNRKLTLDLNTLLEALEPTNGSLHVLNISDCNFFGKISTKLWDFQNLFTVDFKNNSLSGELPKPTDNFFVTLLYFDVSGNNLTGEIPAQFARLQVLQLLDVSSNPLMHETGNIERNLPSYMRIDYKTLTHRNPTDHFTCPHARLNYNDGLVRLDPRYYNYRFCICDVDYYGRGKDCLRCMDGAVCDSSASNHRRMKLKAGFWPSTGGDGNVTHLVECSRVLGASLPGITPCNPSGTCDCQLDWLLTETETGLATVCNTSCLCREGSENRFCSLCAKGFYKQGILCYQCSMTKSSSNIVAVLLVLSVIFIIITFVLNKQRRLLSVFIAAAQIIVLLLLVMFQFIPGWFFELNTLAIIVGLLGRGDTFRGLLKIIMFYLQTLDALISNTDIWPLVVLQVQSYMSSLFNLNLSGLACEFPELFKPLGKLLFLVVLPAGAISCFWLYFGLGCALVKLWDPLQRLFPSRNTCLQLSIITLNLMYFPIVTKTTSVLSHCGEDSGHHYLREAPWQECNGQNYKHLRTVALIATILYVAGIPLALFLLLLKCYVPKTPDERQIAVDCWLGSIYLPYKKKFRSYFEVVFLVRRFLIASFLSFIPQASSFQTTAVCSVLLASLCFQLIFRPFDSHRNIENIAEPLVLATLHITFTQVRYALLNPSSSRVIVWMLIVLNCLVVFILVLCFIGISVIVWRTRAVVLVHEDPNGQHTPDSAPGPSQAPPHSSSGVSAENSSRIPDGAVPSSTVMVEDS